MKLGMQPLAHDVAEGARPETDKFTQNVLRPAVEDFISTLEHQADELAAKVRTRAWGLCSCACKPFEEPCAWTELGRRRLFSRHTPLELIRRWCLSSLGYRMGRTLQPG